MLAAMTMHEHHIEADEECEQYFEVDSPRYLQDENPALMIVELSKEVVD